MSAVVIAVGSLLGAIVAVGGLLLAARRFKTEDQGAFVTTAERISGMQDQLIDRQAKEIETLRALLDTCRRERSVLRRRVNESESR